MSYTYNTWCPGVLVSWCFIPGSNSYRVGSFGISLLPCYTGGMATELLADVAVRAKIADADPVFTYRVPPHLHALVRLGQLVWVPLRRQRVQGIIMALYRWGERGEPSPEDHDLAPPTFRPDPDAPHDPEAPVIRDLADVADP